MTTMTRLPMSQTSIAPTELRFRWRMQADAVPVVPVGSAVLAVPEALEAIVVRADVADAADVVQADLRAAAAVEAAKLSA